MRPTRNANTGNTANKTAMGQTSPLPLHFEYVNGTARKVCLAGSFNDWCPESTEMISLGGGKWAKDLMLPPGTYEYRLVVDGQWLADPGNRENVPNPFGSQNSIKVVPPPGLPHAAGLLADLPRGKQPALARR